MRKDFRYENQIQICEHCKSVYSNVYHTNRHSEFIGEIGTVACAFYKVAVAADTLLIQDEADDEGQGKEDDEEYENKIESPYAIIAFGYAEKKEILFRLLQ